MDAQEYNKKIGDNIKRVRIDIGMSQLDLGVLCNMDRTSINRIESGRTNPTIKTVFEISLALGVEVKELLKE